MTGEDKESLQGNSGPKFLITRGQLDDIYSVLNTVVGETQYEVIPKNQIQPLLDHFGGKEPNNNTPPLELPLNFLKDLFKSDDRRLGPAQYQMLYALTQESRNTGSIIRASLYLVGRYVQIGNDKYRGKITESIEPMSERFVSEIKIFNSLFSVVETRANSGSAGEIFLGLFGAWFGKNGEMKTTLTSISNEIEEMTVELGRKSLPSNVLHPTLQNLASVLQSE